MFTMEQKSFLDCIDFDDNSRTVEGFKSAVEEMRRHTEDDYIVRSLDYIIATATQSSIDEYFSHRHLGNILV